MAREKGVQSANIWLCHLQHLHEGYIPENVFNAYETGLLYRAIPSKSMVMKRSRCTKIKIANKITTVVCVCATEKKNWAVDSWEEYNQHAFMAWRAQILVLIIISRTWMTTAVFTKWVKKLNRMSILKWKILLFVDSCSAHPPIQLTKIVMLPSKTTSHLQPCDAGIIQAVKRNYRKFLLCHFIFEIRQDETANAKAFSKLIFS